MEEIKQMLLKIQADIAHQDIKMRSMEENITKTINSNINEKNFNLILKTKELEQKIEEQEKRINAMDRHSRRKNLVFFGIEESEKSYKQLEQSILEVITDKMEIQCAKSEIDTVRRMGKKQEDKIRPVVVTFASTGRKMAILRGKKSLEATSVYIKEDFPVKVLEKRRQLKDELDQHIKEGKKAVLKYDKIVILNNKSPEKTTSTRPYNKRTLSESPENHVQTPTPNKQVPKKNKIST